MKKFLDRNYWLAVLQSPAAVAGLVVDLAPLIGVLLWGWGAATLVLLYWLENIVLGVAAATRMTIGYVGQRGVPGVLITGFMLAFFTVHYGMFCFGHGSFLLVYLGRDVLTGPDTIPELITAIVGEALSFGDHMDWILALMIVWHALAVYEFIRMGDWKTCVPQGEMFAPYPRIIGLHLGIFVIGGAMAALGSPTVGLFALIFARALWGVHVNIRRDKPAASLAAAAVS
jgi:hypothetical protein